MFHEQLYDVIMYDTKEENNKQIRSRLFCFTCAGGSQNLFSDIEKELPSFDVIKLEYAGHGTRYSEKQYETFGEMTDDLFNRIKDRLSCNYSLFGYSMGSITVIEVLKRIILEQLQLPKCVFLAAHEPHQKKELSNFDLFESDDCLKCRIISFGNVEDRILLNKAFWRTYLPVYRHDFGLISSYDFNKIHLKTQIPAVIFYSESDTPLKEMVLWKQYFLGNCEFHSYGGTHFFIRHFYKEMAEIIRVSMA